MSCKTKSTDPLDLEWINLIKEALELGISKEEIMKFLQKK